MVGALAAHLLIDPLHRAYNGKPRRSGALRKPRRFYLHDYMTASLRSLDARKAIFLLALILMASPVAGLRPMRAGRLRTCRIPRPGMRMRAPFFRCLPTLSTIPVRMLVI